MTALFFISLIINSFSALLFMGRESKTSIIKAAVFGVTTYFFVYVLASAGLFWFDVFSINKSVNLTFGISLILAVVSIVINKFSGIKKIRFDVKEFIFFAAVVVIAILLSGKKFQFFGMGQDQGVYQTKAIELMFDNNSNEYDFEYVKDVLTDPKDYDYFRDTIISLQGYYLVGSKYVLDDSDQIGGESGLRGIYHGIPTWPAILALFGRMFGMSYMQECQTVFFVCFLMIVFYILENFKIITVCEAGVVGILATSPQIVWVAKSALTEMLLAVIFAVFIYLACNKDKNTRFFAWIPVAVFSFFHVSIYTIMPLFIVTGWLIYLADRKVKNVISVMLMLASYTVGYLFMYRVSELYTTFNYCNPLRRFIKNIDTVGLSNVVYAAVGVAILLTVFIFLITRIKAFNKYLDFLNENKGRIVKIISAIVVVLVFFLYVNMSGRLTIDNSMNVISLSIASGLLSGLLSIIGIFAISFKKIKSEPIIVMSVVFIYFLIWASLLRPDIQYFYYYGRYNAPFIMVPIVFLSVLFKEIERFEWVPIICSVSILVYIDFDMVMIRTPDDSRVEWNVIEKELDHLDGDNCALIVDNYHITMQEWLFILKAAGKDVYPRFKDFEKEVNLLENHYDNLYFLIDVTDESMDEYEKSQEIGDLENNEETDDEINKKMLESLTKEQKSAMFDNMDYSLERKYYYLHSQDLINEKYTGIGYPVELYQEKRIVEIYKINTKE